jgi:predicted Rossmann fold flavoprotein
LQKKLIIIGGGAAGFFCAINAAKTTKNLQVIILEKTSKLLSKVKVSGGGRCNVTHHQFEINELVKNYPRGANFLKKTFHQFNTNHTVDWFTNAGVTLHTEKDGRMFPTSNNSQTIVDCLLDQAQKYGVQIKLNSCVEAIHKVENKFYLQLKNQPQIVANYLCIATGGFPKLELFNFIKEIENIAIENPIPSLFTFNIPKNPITALMGVSVEDALVKIKGTKFQFQGPVLITHWGLSGPAVLKLSAFAAKDLHEKQYTFIVQVNWVTSYNESSLLQSWKSIVGSTKQNVANHNPFRLPNRLWDYFLEITQINGDLKWTDVATAKQNALIKILTNMELQVQGKTTFKDEFVTCGGVNIAHIDHNTMQHKTISNLYFAGEVLNIDGITGGFNFQNAWTTAWVAGNAIAKNSN